MAATLYVAIRGNYTQFQRDMDRVKGIARQSATVISDQFNNALNPKFLQKGIGEVGRALKQLGRVASTAGSSLHPYVNEIAELARKSEVSTHTMQKLANAMAETARKNQLAEALKNIQKYAGLTNAELSKLQVRMGDMGGALATAMQGFGVRPLKEIQAEIKNVEADYAHMLELFKKGAATENDVARAFAVRGKRLEALQREAGTWQEPVRASALRQKYDTLVSQAGRGGVSYAQYEARDTARTAVTAFQELRGRLPKASEIQQIAQACGVSAAQIRRMRDELDHTSNAFKALIGYAQVWLTFGFAHTAQDFVKTAMQLENVEVAFKAIYGTSDMAQKKLEYIRQVSDELGLSFMDTAEGAKKLFAAAQGTPVEAEANMVFKAFSNMSAAMKLTGDETKGVFLAISQMISKGKVSAEELRQQLAERMPGAVNLFASSIGVSTQELDKMLQAGSVTLEHFLQFAKAVNERYAAGAAQASHTLQAELARISNTWANFQKDMTDTGKLAGWARSFNEVFKGMTSAIVKYSDEVSTLMHMAFAAWIASSLTPGGKLNSIFSSLSVTLKSAGAAMTGFSASTATAVTRMGMLGKAAGALMKNPFIAGLLTAGTVFGVEKMLEAGEDKNAFDQSGESLRDIIASRAKSAAADKNSQFTPEETRKLLLEDTEKQLKQFDLGMDSLGLNVSKELSKKRDIAENGLFSSEKDVENVNKLTEAYGFATARLREFQQASQQAYDLKKPEDFLKVQKDIAVTWGDVEKKLRDAGASDEMIKNFEAAFKAMDATAGTAFDNISKHLSTFAADSTSAAKTLGLEMDKATVKMFDKLEKASQSSAIGKAAKEIENFQKVAKMLGDSPLAQTFDASTAACGQFANEITTLIGKVGNAEKVSEQYWMQLIQTSEGYRAGSVAQEEFSKAQEQVDAQTKELTDWEGRLATAIFQTAAAAGGTDAQFNVMIEALKAAQQAGIITAEMLDRVLQKVNEVRGAAAAAMQEAMDASIYAAADKEFLSANLNKNFNDKNRELYATNFQLSHMDASGNVPSREAALYAYDRKMSAKKIQDAIKEANKKGKKKGGGGGGKGKRVDNTEEKWHSAEEGWRKKIADMQGQKDVATLAKDFADMDKQLKGSSVDMKALKTDYFKAFDAKYAKDLNKEILQLRGNEKAFAEEEIAEKVKAKAAALEGMAEEAKKLGLTVQDYGPKLKEYEDLLRGQARESQLQKELPYYEKFTWFDGNRKEALEKQNELIAIQAEKMKGTIPDELIQRWRELEELQNRVKNGNDVLAGISLGAKKYALEMGNMAENVSDLVQKSFGDMADAFTDLVMTGKANFTDLANSIIKDLMRIAIQQAIVGPIANGIGNLFGSFGGGSFNWGSAASASNFSAVGGGVGGTQFFTTIGGHALGDVFAGLKGFSNSIVSRPTLFSYGSQLTKFAKGGVMGEAGPEAVMPLMRTASGHLGVRSEGSQAPIVNVVINNSTGQSASQRTKTDNQGNKSIEVMIGDMAAQQMMKTGTSLNKAARSFSGVSQQVTRR